ncbi:MAG: PAS domain S-box protein [Myxococcales bacterium]|nr:PAS domain S-box protein [Myxococcales bacterium]
MTAIEGLSLLEHAPLAAYVFRRVEADYVLEFVNARARQDHPTITNVIGKPMLVLYQDQPEVVEAAERCLRDRSPVTIEVPVRRYDRVEATMLLRLHFVAVGDAHLVIYVQDVATDDVRATALRESEARYRSLVTSMPDAVILRGPSGRILACNDVAARLFGAEREADLLGREDFIRADMTVVDESGNVLPRHQYPSRVALSGKHVPPTVIGLDAPDAPRRWFRVAAQPVPGTDGTTAGSVATFTDITERAKAQRELRESAARLDLALSAARMGVWAYTPHTDEGTWSDNLDAVFDLPERGRGMQTWLENVHPDDREGILSHTLAIAQGEDGASFDHDFRMIGKDGTVRWARIRGSASRGPHGPHFRGTLMDVTEQHRLEEELRRASRLESIGRLAGGVAHDFNNLLAAMMGSLELVEDLCPPTAQEDLATIRHAALRARDLTRQLLAFARKQPLEFKVVDVDAMVRDVDRMLRRVVGPEIEVHVEGTPGVCVRADVSLLEQVLVNLVVNAREAMPRGGRLDIRVAAISGADDLAQVLIEVVDSGVGMDEDTVRHVFDPFFTTKSQGSGLGLASSYGIVQQHGGDIVVTSRPGQGACFQVRLPRWIQSPSTSAKDVEPPRKGRECVLVIDDEDMVRATAVRLLQSLGYHVLSASSAAEALTVAAQHEGRIDLLLCDVAMPGRSGPSVARELVGLRPELKVIFVSGYAELNHEPPLPGAVFLQKPYVRAELAAKLHQLLGSTPPR